MLVKNIFDIVVIGGGAAGFFAAINLKEKNPQINIAILEKGKDVLTKVKISGGGRCNVTNAESKPAELAKNYPRGEKELKSLFYTFGSAEMHEWFAHRNIELKTESDGRVFPKSDTSQTIIDCFLNETKRLKIPIYTQQNVLDFHKNEAETWELKTAETIYFTKKIVLTTGSNPKFWNVCKKLGHTIVEPVPSLFTFAINDEKLHHLMGISAEVSLKILDTKLQSTGTMLITHWGLSGPAILRLSAWGARILAEKKYNFTLEINWLNELNFEITFETLKKLKNEHPKKIIFKNPAFGLTHRLWEYLLMQSNVPENLTFADSSHKILQKIAEQLTKSTYKVTGKSTFKDEFVTAGGIERKEINFKNMESRVVKNLYFAGEIIDIDAITGGFNFQNAWTTAWMVSEVTIN